MHIYMGMGMDMGMDMDMDICSGLDKWMETEEKIIRMGIGGKKLINLVL